VGAQIGSRSDDADLAVKFIGAGDVFFAAVLGHGQGEVGNSNKGANGKFDGFECRFEIFVDCGRRWDTTPIDFLNI
jgi:hypothetical protein